MTQLIQPYKPQHPVFRVYTRAEAERILDVEGADGYNSRMKRRNELIRSAEVDPHNFVYQLVTWKLADCILGFRSWQDLVDDPDVPQRWKDSSALAKFMEEAAPLLMVVLLLGGNRAAKTEYMMWRAMQCFARYKCNLWIFHQNERMSIDYHQKIAFHYLPVEWKELGKSRKSTDTTYISYTQQNGFSSNKMTSPLGGLCSFLNYEQDPEKTIEGGDLGAEDKSLCLGYVADELLPLSWMETLRYRLVTRGAKGVIGFTPINFYTDTVAAFCDGAGDVYGEYWKIIQDEKKRIVPLVQRSAMKERSIVYFHTVYNPFANFKGLYEAVKELPDDVKLMRMFGVAGKRAGRRFVGFDQNVHVVPPSRIYREKEPGMAEEWAFDGTNWHILDPAGSKRWFMLWLRVDAYNRIWVYREWPSQKIYVPGLGLPEPWALPGARKGHNHDGIPGPGSDPINWDLWQYKEEIARLEQWEDVGTDTAVQEWEASRGSKDDVYMRYIDSRYCASPSYTQAGNTTLLEECQKIGLPFEPTFSQQGRTTIDEGAELINHALGFKEDWKTPQDSPKLFISEDCQNLIFSLSIWTNKDGQSGATKDPIDCLRYALMAQISYVERNAPRATYGQRLRGASKEPEFDPHKKKNIFAKAAARGGRPVRRRR